MSKEIIKNNSDFIFIYEAKQTNPNGDPDMENKPRMDYDTKTNLVSKYRRKRDIRDYAKCNDKAIFVDTINDNKVAADTRLNYIIDEFLKEENKNNAKKILDKIKIWVDILNIGQKEFKDKTFKEIYKALKENEKKKGSEKNKALSDKFSDFNNELLTEIIKLELYDIRLFGGAFAIEGFSRTFTGPVQLSWGYSLHPVELMKSNSLVTIMNDDSSTFGKTQNVEYSLIAFSGTISKNLADKTGLTDDDIIFFRKAMIESINNNPTASKSNQYPVLYLELEYEEKFNGFLYDMRNMIDYKPKNKDAIIRSYKDLDLDFSRLISFINDNKKLIKNIYLWESNFITDEFKPKIKEKIKSLENMKEIVQEVFEDEEKKNG